MGDKGAEENTGMKDGMTREDNIPVNMFVGVATGTGGVLDESVDGKNPIGTDEDQGAMKATCIQVSRTRRKGRTLGGNGRKALRN